MHYSADLVAIDSIPKIRFDLRYQSEKNFLGKNVYGDSNTRFLHRIAAEKLHSAATELQKLAPTACLYIFDALRPRSAQNTMWKEVEGTALQKYVASPSVGSLHCFGMAVDLTIGESSGSLWDMGTDFDEFRSSSEPKHESIHLTHGVLSAAQISNRRFLRSLMVRAGFEPISTEWWHFNALPANIVREQFTFVE